jgi:hypothetical protein
MTLSLLTTWTRDGAFMLAVLDRLTLEKRKIKIFLSHGSMVLHTLEQVEQIRYACGERKPQLAG